MTAARPPWKISDAYREYARLTRELHRLFMQGKHEGEEPDALRDASEAPWLKMGHRERERAAGLSGDLYSIEEPLVVPKPMTPEADAAMTSAVKAMDNGKWDAALDWVRTCEDHLPPVATAQLRADIYAMAGDAESAALFNAHAESLGGVATFHASPVVRAGEIQIAWDVVVQPPLVGDRQTISPIT